MLNAVAGSVLLESQEILGVVFAIPAVPAESTFCCASLLEQGAAQLAGGPPSPSFDQGVTSATGEKFLRTKVHRKYHCSILVSTPGGYPGVDT